MEKISAVYKIVNTVTGDCYVGSSKNVKSRWAEHKCPSSWKEQPNHPLYIDMQKYGVDKFQFQIITPVMPECLTRVEQEFIEMLHPSYNDKNAKGLNVERQKEYRKSGKGRDVARKAARKYSKSDRGKEVRHKYAKKYRSQICIYNGERITLNALRVRFYRAGVENPIQEAKKYLLCQ